MALDQLKPSMYLSRFTGSNPTRWLLDAEWFFSFHAIFEEERFPYVVEFFDDEPFSWFNSWYRCDNLTWTDFTRALLSRFMTPTINLQPAPTMELAAPPSSMPPPSLRAPPKRPSLSTPFSRTTVSPSKKPTQKQVPLQKSATKRAPLPHLFALRSIPFVNQCSKLKNEDPDATIRREWRPPWQAPYRHIDTKPNATGRNEWRPPWPANSVLEDKDVFQGGSIDTNHLLAHVFLCKTYHSNITTTTAHGGDHPLSKIAIHHTLFALDHTASLKPSPLLLGSKGQTSEWLTLTLHNPNPSIHDWIGVFSPANFSASTCVPESSMVAPPLLCTAPIKYQYANYTTPNYIHTGNASLKFRLINQRSDFSFALFSGGLSKPKLVAVSTSVVFGNPNAPNYPRLAQGKTWNEMTVTWTSGYGLDKAEPLVEWGRRGEDKQRSPAGTLTIDRNSLCGAPARTVGWRDPGFIHTGFLKELWPNSVYTYKLGHKLLNGSVIWSQVYQFKSSPYPGQNSLQRVIIFGDMGKDEADGSNDYNNYQHGSLNTTKQLIGDLKNYDIVFHIGDICYANGYLSQWDQFTAQVEPIASAVPYMIASGNHERDWPNSGSFYENNDSGGECGVLAETMFYVPAENRAKFWYSTDYGMFRFCIADTEHDWREGTEQYKFIEQCFATVDRQKQPWLIFLAHRVLGYSSTSFYAVDGAFGEPMGRESLQKLWQKYKVDIAIYGHAHNYERTCPVYQNTCTSKEKHAYKGSLNGTIHVVAGGGGASLTNFANINTTWSLVKDVDYGFLKLTAFDHSNLLFEYKKSSNGEVFDSFNISRDYKDIVACTPGSCPTTTLAS